MEQPAASSETDGRHGGGSTAMCKDAGTADPTGLAQAPATIAHDDRLLIVGWKYDPARDRLSPTATICTYYRDAQRREGHVVSCVLIGRKERHRPQA